MANDSKENEPLIEGSEHSESTSRRALKIGLGTVLALSVAAAITLTPLSPFADGANLRGSAAGGSPTPYYPPWIDDLNKQIAQSPNFHDDPRFNVYNGNGNVGVIFRALDDGQTMWWDMGDGKGPQDASPISDRCLDDLMGTPINCVAASTFWHNDIVAVTQFYESDPLCPTQTGEDCNDQGDGWGDPWDLPAVGVVIGKNLKDVLEASNMPEFDNIQNNAEQGGWGYGVFYPHDSNAADSRCFFTEYASGQCMYECKDGYVDATCDGDMIGWVDAPGKIGAGAYPAGNPWVHTEAGGGAGCHFDPDNNYINQIGMDPLVGTDFPTLTQDGSCQCNYLYKDDWANWVDIMKLYSDRDFGTDVYGSWMGDYAACWVSNFHELIRLQNALYWKRAAYLDNLTPESSFDFKKKGELARKYWGWNEIPLKSGSFNTPGLNYPLYHDAIAIALPAFSCGTHKHKYEQDNFWCLNDKAKAHLDATLANYELNGILLPGAANAAQRPGSSVAFVRQNPDYFDLSDKHVDSTMGWTKEFYCEYAETEHYKVVYDDNSKACYVDYK